MSAGVPIGAAGATIGAVVASTTATTSTTGAPDFQAALDSLTLIEGDYEGIQVLGAVANEDYDANGALIDTIQISYSIIGRPGVFNVSVPYAFNWQAIAFFYIGLQANTIELIYEGASSLAETPSVYLTETATPPPTSQQYYEWQTVNGQRQLVGVPYEPIATPGSPVLQ